MAIAGRTPSTGTIASGTDFTVTVPAGTADGDLLIVGISLASTSQPTVPSSWLALITSSAGTSQSLGTWAVRYSSTVNLTCTGVPAALGVWVCNAYFDGTLAVHVDAALGAVNSTNNTTMPTGAPTARGNVAGDYEVMVWGWTSSATLTAAANMTKDSANIANGTAIAAALGHANSTLGANAVATAFAPTLSASNQRKAGIGILLLSAPAPAVWTDVSLADAFDNASLDTGLWTTYGAGVTVTETTALNVAPPGTSGVYGGIVSNSTFDLTGKECSVRLSGRLSLNANNVTSLFLQASSGNNLEFAVVGSALISRRAVASTQTQIQSTNIQAGDLPWLSISESGGVTYFQMSLDRVTWTYWGRVPNPITMTALQVILQAGCAALVTTPGTAQFNGLNTTYVSYRNLTGTATGVAAASGSLRRRRALTGSAAGAAVTTAAAPTRRRPLSGAAAGAAVTTATISKGTSGGTSPATTKPAPSDTVTFDSGNALAANLKIWLAMIETSGASLADSAGTPQNGTVAGTLTRVTGPNGGQSIALTTDNAQRIGLGDQPTHGLSTGQFQAFTFSLWVRFDNVDFANKTLFTGGYFSDGPNLAARPPYDLKYVYGGPGSTTSTAAFYDPGLAANTWYHLCFTDSGADVAGAVKLYVNGVAATPHPDSSYSGSGKSGVWDKNGTYGAFFGAEPFGDNWHPATYDSLMIFERALSAAEVSSLYTSPFQLFLVGGGPVYKNLTGASTGQATVSASPTRRRALVGLATGQATVSASPTRQRALVGQASGQATASATLTKVTPPSGDAYGDLIKGTSGLLAYYRLNESATGTAADSSSNARDGSYSGGGVYYSNPSPITSNPGNTAVAFDGATGRVALPSSLTLAAGSAVTIEYWIKTITAGQNVAFTIGGLEAPSRCIAHCPWEDNVLYWDYGSYTTNRLTTNFAPYLGVWTHVALTYGGGTQAIYLNGVQAASMPSTNASTDTLAGGAIGQGLGFASINAYVDEFAVYNVALTPAQVQAHYDAATATGPTYKNLTGSAAGSAATSASLTRERRLTAAAVGAASVSASSTRQRQLTASAVGVALATAVPTRQRRLVAAAAGVASTLASPTRLRALVASAAGLAVTLASPTRRRALLASASGSSSTTAFLSRGGTPQRDLLAIASGIASTSAALTRRRALVATAVGVATSAASLTRRRALVAQATGQAAASGTISKSVLATGTVFWIGPPTAQFGPSGTVPLRWEGDQFVTATADPVVSFAGGQFDT